MVYEYIHVEDFSDREKAQTWHSKTDLKNIKRDNEVTIRRMIAGVCFGNDYCPRGLEHRTSMGARVREKHRRDAVSAVLEYQSLLWEAGVESNNNDQNLARVYSHHTDHSARVAHLMAVIDEQNIKSDDTTKRPSTKHPLTPCKRCREKGYNSPSHLAMAA
jgi:hypothetical protein